MSNCTTVMEFFLLGFSAVQKLQLVHTTLFPLLYLAALMRNLLLDAITTLDRSVSFLGCVLQVFFFISFASSESTLLTALSYDHYVAICCPLHYEVIRNPRACWKIASTSWLSGGLSGIMHSATISFLPFWGGIVVRQFFYDIPQHMRLSGSEDMLQEVGVCTFLTLLSLICFTFIGISYVHPFWAVLNMLSVEGRVKAFSTCLPHLVVVIIFLSMSSFEYLKPPSNFPSTLDLLFPSPFHFFH
ncbi:olfactory receptor 14J1-like [Tachyglossus aculeatus]|uniref:olfactory receptor 14J1-like n=1 Tax=Tachyglossus aculeatus TaxID=9261 RepID=UPI0018F5D698|nr:olfactory receptor 14J1-like [Tachyglossus aculeatus]